MPFNPPTEEELQQVQHIKERLSTAVEGQLSPKITDVTILRFLRGMKYNLDEAFTRVVDYDKWRKEHSVDTIHELEGRIQRYFENGLCGVEGKDFNNRPLGYGAARVHDKYNRDIEDMRILIIFVLEKLIANAIPHEERFTIVFDLNGFSLKCMDYEVVKVLVSILQTHYPETLEKVFVVDAPFIFWACWSIIKPWLDPVTAAKVTFIKKAELKDHLDDNLIPSLKA
jgi:hypothetical protein